MQPPVPITHLLLLGSLSSMACDLSAPSLQPGKTVASPRGKHCLPPSHPPHRATDSTLIIQGRMSRWLSHSRTLVWQLSPNPQSHPEAEAGCPTRSSEGVQGVGITAQSQEQQAAPRPGSCYFELPSKPPTQSLLILFPPH